MENSSEPTTAAESDIKRPTARRILRTAEFEPSKNEDLAGMFGRWKEADHCDKD